jgi:hypothetical protein
VNEEASAESAQSADCFFGLFVALVYETGSNRIPRAAAGNAG